MDTKLIQQYGEDILCYRLRTARQKKRMQCEDFDKYLIQLHKEEKELIRQERNLGWEPLNPPIQRGWKRFFVLRDDVVRSKHAEFFEKILKKINTHDWSHRKDFLVKKKKRGRKIYVVKPQQILRPYPWQITKLGLTETEMQLFHETWELDWKKQPVKRYAFNEPWRFVLKTRPNIIDKVRARDEEIEQRLDEIRSWLRDNCFERRQYKLLYGNYRYRWRDYDMKEKEKNAFAFKSLQQVLDITMNSDIY